MKGIIHNHAIHVALIAALLILAVAADDAVTDALFKSLIVFAALNFFRTFSQGASPASDDSSNNLKK